jgi:acetyl esterase
VQGRDDPSTPLDPGMAQFCKVLGDATPPGAELWPLQQQRDAWNALCRSFRAPRPDNINVEDVVANGVPSRVFTPTTKGPHAGVIYGHGGGWVLGGPDTHDDMCAEMASAANCVVVLMDYRLAPEHPYPAQLEDSLKVWRWMREQQSIDPNRIIAAGDSAGGQMSVALAMILRDLGLPQVNAMVLILGPEGAPPWSDEKALPLLAQNVEGLPPAFITVAGHDPLHDDGAMFHQRLLSAGVASQLREEPALGHSYMRARNHSPVAMQAFEAIVAALKAFAA